jgi:hypothetical protein
MDGLGMQIMIGIRTFMMPARIRTTRCIQCQLQTRMLAYQLFQYMSVMIIWNQISSVLHTIVCSGIQCVPSSLPVGLSERQQLLISYHSPSLIKIYTSALGRDFRSHLFMCYRNDAVRPTFLSQLGREQELSVVSPQSTYPDQHQLYVRLTI